MPTKRVPIHRDFRRGQVTPGMGCEILPRLCACAATPEMHSVAILLKH